MRHTLVLSILTFPLFAGCGSNSGGPNPVTSNATAAIVLRAPTTQPARVCTRCGGTPGELETATDLVVEETAGVAGQVTGVAVLFSNATRTIEGPGVFDALVLNNFGVTNLRVAARGSLTMPQIGVHFAGSLRDQLPATLRFTVNFRDDNGHTLSSNEVSILITPPVS